jgi:hypothetical protein
MSKREGCTIHDDCDRECKHDTHALIYGPAVGKTVSNRNLEALKSGSKVQEGICEHCDHKLLLIKTD